VAVMIVIVVVVVVVVVSELKPINNENKVR
jgi:hypothetical protein